MTDTPDDGPELVYDPAGDVWRTHRDKAATTLARIEDRLHTAATRALGQWTALVAAAVLDDRHLTAAADTPDGPVDPTAPPPLPPDPGAIPALAPAWQALAHTHIVTAIGDVLGEVFAETLRDPAVVSARPWQEQYLTEVSNRLSHIPGTTFDLVRDDVRAGIDAGESIPKIRDRVQATLDANGETSWPNRATTIARTEAISAFAGGQLAAWEAEADATGETLHRAWVATVDQRTRSTHFRADGQRRPLGEPFEVGGAKLQHPGDPTGPPEECIQCRCSMIILSADEEIPSAANRGFRDPAEVQAEIDRRAAQDPPVVRAYEDPDEQARQAALVDAARTVTAAPDCPVPDSPDTLPTTDTTEALSGDTDTAAGSGPGAHPEPPGEHPMPRTWKSAPFLAPFAQPTGDGRIFKVGSLTARDLPLPLLFQPASGMGHDGSVVVGRILDVQFTDTGIEATGDYLDADPSLAPDLSKAVEQAVALTAQGLGHVSVDLSDVVGELVDEDGNPISMEDIFDAWDRGEDPKVLEQISEGKLIACTQVATPAFEGAKIELAATDAPAAAGPATADPSAEAALQDTAGTDIGVGDVVDVDTPDGAIRGEVTALDEQAEEVTVQPTDTDGAPLDGDALVVTPDAVTVVTKAADEKADKPEDGADAPAGAAAQQASLLAAAGPLRPPAAWFEDPQLTGPTAMTVTDDGRVYGHVAVWGQCHVGFSNTCVTPPTSPSSYKHFHVGEVVTADGSRVAVGNLTLGGRHADVRLAYRSAIEHYDVSGAGVAVVRAYEDEHGIAFAGALTPGVTDEQIYDLRRSPVSGDWRRVGGELEMIGVLSVNAGGFNTPRFATDEAGRTALVAAPSVRPAEDALVASGKRRPGMSQAELTERITASVTARVRAELAEDRARVERAKQLRGLAVAIKADPQSRLQALAERMTAPKRQARAERLAALAAQVSTR